MKLSKRWLSASPSTSSKMKIYFGLLYKTKISFDMYILTNTRKINKFTHAIMLGKRKFNTRFFSIGERYKLGLFRFKLITS